MAGRQQMVLQLPHNVTCDLNFGCPSPDPSQHGSSTFFNPDYSYRTVNSRHRARKNPGIATASMQSSHGEPKTGNNAEKASVCRKWGFCSVIHKTAKRFLVRMTIFPAEIVNLSYRTSRHVKSWNNSLRLHLKKREKLLH